MYIQQLDDQLKNFTEFLINDAAFSTKSQKNFVRKK